MIFSFALHDKRYRIRRVPDQLRPKTRGEGHTQQSAEAQLWELDENNDPTRIIVSSKVTDATREIEGILGLNADQFRQVMVLPQGKFRQLLTADSKDRERIFSQLFQTHIYKRLEDELKERSAGIRRELDIFSKQKAAYLSGVNLETEAELDAAVIAHSQVASQAKAQLVQQQQVTEQLTQNLHSAQALIKRFALLEQLKQTATELNLQATEIKAQQNRLQELEEAAGLQPDYQGFVAMTAQATKLKQDISSAANNLTIHEPLLAKTVQALTQIPTIESQISTLNTQLVHLQGFVAKAEELQQERVQIDQHLKIAHRHLEQEQRIKQQIDRAKASLETQEKDLAQRRDEIEQNADLASRLERDTHFCTIKQRITQHESRLALKLQALHTSKEQGTQLKLLAEAHHKEADQLALKWHLAQASLLAAQLEEGVACPVCGSHSHPAPAASAGLDISQADLETARQIAQDSSNKLQSERDNYRFINNEIETLSKEISSDNLLLGELHSLSLQEMQQRVEDGRRVLTAHHTRKDELKNIEQNYQRLKADLDPLQSQYDAIKQTRETAEQTLAIGKNNIERLERDIPEDLRQHRALQQAILDKNNAIQNLVTQIQSIQQQHAQAKSKFDELTANLQLLKQQLIAHEATLSAAESEWNSALTQSRFTSLAQFTDALSDLAQRGTLRALINQYQEKVSENQGALQSLSNELSDASLPNIDDLTDQLVAAKNTLEEVEALWQQKHEFYVLLNNAQTQLAQLKSKSIQLEQQYATVGTLSDIANGHNDSKVSLQRFVLSVLLDDVLMEASQRLLSMSKGRYRLLRKEDRSKGNRASGLDLEVEDAYTGRVRAVATLSGGESFMAALALALGLSDVVQAYAGGIRLDTLFIDEGFGSLDPESLDLAIRTLMDLQQTGRMIGIISHVSELKEQIPLRIDISSSEIGSRILWRT